MANDPSTGQANPASSSAFPWQGLLYPSIWPLLAWVLLIVPQVFFGVVYDHSFAPLLWILLPWTLVVWVLLTNRVPPALKLLRQAPDLRSPRNIASTIVAILLLLWPIFAFVSWIVQWQK